MKEMPNETQKGYEGSQPSYLRMVSSYFLLPSVTSMYQISSYLIFQNRIFHFWNFMYEGE